MAPRPFDVLRSREELEPSSRCKMTLIPVHGRNKIQSPYLTGIRIRRGLRRLLTTLKTDQEPTTKESMSKPSMNKPSRKPDDGQPKTLDAAKTRIAELEAKLAGKQRIPSTVEPTSNVTSLKKPSNRPNTAPVNAFKETMAAALPSSLQSLEAISNALKAESNPGARLTYLNKAVASYREAVTAEKDFGKQTELCRQKARVERAQAYEMQRQGKLRDAYKFPTEDLA